MSRLGFIKKMDKNTILVGIAVIGIIITGVLIFASSNKSFSIQDLFGSSPAQIGQKAVDFINKSGLTKSKVTLKSASEESGLVKIKIDVGGQSFDSYVTKDGKLLFPDARQAIDMTAKSTTASQNQNASGGSAQTADQIIASIKKTDAPSLEAFVVSSCPFGLQMQRMIADAVKNIPSLSSNVVVRYIGSVSSGQISSMHDASPNGQEAQENLRQICIRQEQPAKYWSYVSCYMQKASGALPNGMPLGDSKGCLASTGVDTAKLNSCMTSPSKGLAYAQKDFDLASKYSVSGSPTLVLGGTTVAEFTADNKPVFGGRAADEIKTIICDASKTQPGFCSTKLNTAQAATSFSATYASASGSTGSNTNCAPAK
jgi:FKBP-type peptidyl-prolyl cis-trans isomerase